MKDKLIIAIHDLEEDKCNPSESDSTDWMHMIDRGGLFHINDEAYRFFHCMEMLVRKFFHVGNIKTLILKLKTD